MKTFSNYSTGSVGNQPMQINKSRKRNISSAKLDERTSCPPPLQMLNVPLRTQNTHIDQQGMGFEMKICVDALAILFQFYTNFKLRELTRERKRVKEEKRDRENTSSSMSKSLQCEMMSELCCKIYITHTHRKREGERELQSKITEWEGWDRDRSGCFRSWGQSIGIVCCSCHVILLFLSPVKRRCQV